MAKADETYIMMSFLQFLIHQQKYHSLKEKLVAEVRKSKRNALFTSEIMKLLRDAQIDTHLYTHMQIQIYTNIIILFLNNLTGYNIQTFKYCRLHFSPMFQIVCCVCFCFSCQALIPDS